MQKLLALAKEEIGADSAYLAEPCSQGLEITAALPDHLNFRGIVFSVSARPLPAVRCWNEKDLIAWPDIKKATQIINDIRQTFADSNLVWHSQDSTWTSDLFVEHIVNTMQSLVALPLKAGENQTAVIILHSHKPYHFDYEKIDRLKKLIARAGWVLAMVARRNEERQLFLDGVLHEIKSNLLPLRHALDDLPIAKDNSDWLRAYLCEERLSLATKNLLSITRNVPVTQASCQLLCVLKKLDEIYAPEILDFEQQVVFDPPLSDPLWLTSLLISEEWLMHVVANLFDNAVKYAGRNAHIQISGTIEENLGVREFVLLADNPGKLSAMEINTVFDAENHSIQGSGFHVGLASCQKVMALHGGQIHLDCQQIHNTDHIIVTLRWLLDTETGDC